MEVDSSKIVYKFDKYALMLKKKNRLFKRKYRIID